MPMPQDLLPRTFQANLHRFYVRVMLPALANLPLHDGVKTSGHASTMTEFLEHAEMHTSNLLAFEMRRCFALTLAGLFERQLRIWTRANGTQAQSAKAGAILFSPLLQEAAERHALDLKNYGVGSTIEELHLLANAVRHGDGRAIDQLRQRAPHLWEYVDNTITAKSEQYSVLSESIQLSDDDFARYVRAVIRFWGLVDHEPGTTVDLPY